MILHSKSVDALLLGTIIAILTGSWRVPFLRGGSSIWLPVLVMWSALMEGNISRECWRDPCNIDTFKDAMSLYHVHVLVILQRIHEMGEYL